MSVSKRERLEKAVAREPVDRIPIALWRHFPGDDQSADELVASTVEFQRTYDFDFIKIMPPSSYPTRDWGSVSAWLGGDEGTVRYTDYPIRNPEDWSKLTVLEPKGGSLGEQWRAVAGLQEALGDEVPYIMTIFSPLSQAKNLAGASLLNHLRHQPDALRAGFETITETTLRYMDAIKPLGIAGIFYAAQWASSQYLSRDEYVAYCRPYDLRILDAVQDCWFNLLHIHGEDIYFDLLADYPVQALNWHARETAPPLAEGHAAFKGAVVGGLRRDETLMQGSPAAVRAEAQDAIEQTGGRGLVLGTGCVTMVTTPLSNIRAARAAVESA